MGAVVGIQRAAFPPGTGIVNASVHAAGVEAQRIGDAEIGPLPARGIQRDQRIGIRSGDKWSVGTEPDYVLLIDPIEIVEVGGNVGALEFGTGSLIQRPTFLALGAVDLLGSGQVLALA